EVEMNQGNYIFIVNGLPKHWSLQWQIFSFATFIFFLSLTGYVAPIEFIFRYVLVVKGVTLSALHLAGMALFVIVLSLIHAIFVFLACSTVPDPQAAFAHLMTDPMWTMNGEKAAYFGADKDSIFYHLFMASVSICDQCVGAIVVLTSISTLRTLRRKAGEMTTKTRYMQSQLNRLMFAEAASLAIVVVIPFGGAMMALFLKVRCVGLGVLLATLVIWIPTVNP
ncbi:hypothetical protein AAVH_35779, partial [Aphelenchoides avenae]